ncbi:MAG: ABC transporter permease [Acidobacteriia bacterium]|nr:ABC transporter permease [Terriglobia bacterium]
MNKLPRDLRAAVRALTRRPGVTALAVVSLGLAIGFSTAAFSVLDAYALRDVPVREPRQLARISVTTREQRGDLDSWVEYLALAARTRSFAGVTAESRRGPRVKLPDRDDFPITANVSDNYFDVLGVRALMGDVFHGGKGQDGTVVISHHYWKTALGGDPNIVGRILQVNQSSLRILGVLPAGFTGPSRGMLEDLFAPSQTYFGTLRMAFPNNLRFTDYELLGRLRPGATMEQATAEWEAILRQMEKEGLAPAPGRNGKILPFTENSLWQKLEANAVMLGVVVLLVLIAAANLANLRLVDNESRRHETGIRLALGAGRGVLARQHLTETLLLGGVGTALGLLLAAWLIAIAPALFYGGDRYTDYGIRLDARTFLFSSAALLGVALIGGLIPWSDAWRRRIIPAISGSRTTGTSRWLAVLVVGQMALVTGVTCSAGLLWRSLQNISAIRPAMDPDSRLLIVNGSLNVDEGQAAFVDALGTRLAGLPGVERVAWARRAMLSGSGWAAIEDVELPGQPKLQFHFNQVGPSYFATTRARILAGRPFAESDGPAATPVIMVNSAFARRFLSDHPALGAWVKASGKDRQVVGVVEDGPSSTLREKIEPFLYYPFAQMPTTDLTFFLASRQDPALLAGAVRAFLHRPENAYVAFEMATMHQFMRNARSDEELAAQVTGGLAGVGLLLAAAGLFGVSLYAVARRTPEFGVRVAMGATPARLVRLVLREAGVRIAIALPLGWALAYVGRRALEKLLYGVAADDPWTFLAASAVVAAVGCAAALHPALRAARTDPLVALRHE